MRFPLVIQDGTIARGLELERALSSLMNEDEFRAFYERTARPLWAYLSRMTGNRQEADDILQEAYYRFYRAGAQHADETHRRNSLFQIATNIVRDAARRSKRRDDVPYDEESQAARAPRSTTPAPDREVAVRTDLARAMQQLEPVQREMLWLAYAQGASHEEIAEVLGLRPVSIRTLLLRARRKLAGLLAGDAAREAGR
ncbi:MAG TPA: RNA polymerase sigma factor [Thermoanaerobaculia bacterium]